MDHENGAKPDEGNKEGKQISKEKKVRALAQSLSNSMSDTGIDLCNRHFWIKNSENKARTVWDLGKRMGEVCERDDEEVVRRLVEMEQRDQALAKTELAAVGNVTVFFMLILSYNM